MAQSLEIPKEDSHHEHLARSVVVGTALNLLLSSNLSSSFQPFKTRFRTLDNTGSPGFDITGCYWKGV